MSAVIEHKYNGVTVLQREDGYWKATAMCQANGKLWGNYWRNESTQEFLTELSVDMGIPISELVQVRKGGNHLQKGTWVHRRVAVHLAQWCSPLFAVRVSGWIGELLTRGQIDPRRASF
jgi:hypothetical protein